MERYRNVVTIVNSAEKYDLNAIIGLIEESDPEGLAEDIAYIVTTLRASMSPLAWTNVKAYFRRDITNHEFVSQTMDI